MTITQKPPTVRGSAGKSRALRIGFLSLTDAAPLVAAQELGMFERQGLSVELRREIGWATIRDKIIYGELDAAHAPAPMLWSAQLGLGCPPCEVLTALVLNLNGNAITLSRALWDAGVRDGTSLREHALARRERQPLTFGVVFTYSSHHLLLAHWLRSAGLEPERDVRIVVVPPAQMFRNLAARTIDGFCAGEPWNTLAVHGVERGVAAGARRKGAHGHTTVRRNSRRRACPACSRGRGSRRVVRRTAPSRAADRPARRPTLS